VALCAWHGIASVSRHSTPSETAVLGRRFRFRLVQGAVFLRTFASIGAAGDALLAG
jgi:hypothetical protein